eukprot:gene13132-17599_t
MSYHIPSISEYCSKHLTPDLINKEAFINQLQAFKEEDKSYVYDNMCSIMSLKDILFLMISSEGGLSAIYTHNEYGQQTPNNSIHLLSLDKYNKIIVNENRDFESTLGLGPNWRDELSDSNDSNN